MIKDYTNSPILITGAARSGTSMVGACVHLSGAWKGDTVGPSRFNAKGMYENHELRESLIKPLLRSLGADARGQHPLPDTSKILIPQDFKKRVIGIIKKQGWTPDQPWMYKCCKMSLMWPVWRYAFPDSKWIIVRRKKEDIVNSCLKTAFMNSFARVNIQKRVGAKNAVEGWDWWVEAHKEKFNEIINSGINAKVVWPERMIKADYSEIKDSVEWLGLDWNGEAITDFIEPKLWKSRK